MAEESRFSELEENETEDVKIPESYRDAEEAVIGMFMQDEECAALIAQSGLREEHFTKKRNRVLFPIVLNVRLNRGVCTVDLVSDECEKQLMGNGQDALAYIGGVATLTGMLHAVESFDLKTAEEYVRMVFERHRLHRLKDVGAWFSGLKNLDESKVIEKVTDMQNILQDNNLDRHGLVRLDNLVTDSYARYKDRKLHPEQYIGMKTGFYFLDRYKAVAKKRLTVFGARTNVGKSIMCSNIITRLAMNGNYVLLFTPELDKEEYIDRMVCAEAGISIDDWKEAIITSSELKRIDKVREAFSSVAADKLFIEDKGVQTSSFIINSIRRHMLSHKVDVVCIDYLQKLKYYGDNTKKAITDIVGNLFSFAKDNDIAIILVSQLKRTKNPDPELSDLKESGDIENFSDVVVLLHRDSITKLRERNKGWYKIAKNRQGATTDEVFLDFDEWALRFKETDTPDDSEDLFGMQSIEDSTETITEQGVMQKVQEYDDGVGNNGNEKGI